MEKALFDTKKYSKLHITVMYVFRASFNDTYWLEEKDIPLGSLDEGALFDPYFGRNKGEAVEIALLSCSDDKAVFLEKREDKATEHIVLNGGELIVCDDFDESMLIAAHISLR